MKTIKGIAALVCALFGCSFLSYGSLIAVMRVHPATGFFVWLCMVVFAVGGTLWLGYLIRDEEIKQN